MNALEETLGNVSKKIGRTHSIIVTMLVKRMTSRGELAHVASELRRAAVAIDQLVMSNTRGVS